jgi:hypothetical protein
VCVLSTIDNTEVETLKLAFQLHFSCISNKMHLHFNCISVAFQIKCKRKAGSQELERQRRLKEKEKAGSRKKKSHINSSLKTETEKVERLITILGVWYVFR